MSRRFSPTWLLIAVFVALGALAVRPSPSRVVDPTSSQAGVAARVEQPPSGAAVATPRAAGETNVDPAVTPEAPPEDQCAFWHATDERMGLSVGQWAAASSAVVYARVVEVGAGQWNTKDGRAPRGEEPIQASDMMHLVRLAPIETLAGDLPSTTVWVPGGVIGCLTIVVDEYDLQPGNEYLFFMRRHDALVGPEGAPNVRLAWPVAEDGSISTQIDGALSLDEVKSLIARG